MRREDDRRAGCPRSAGGQGGGASLLRWAALLAGFAALLWFVIRVLPKPSRAAYPCQRAAFPLAAGFVAWLAGAAGSFALLRGVERAFARRARVAGSLCAAAAIAVVWCLLGTNGPELVLGEAHAVNAPIGVGRGIHPGRVVWVHDPAAVKWEGQGRWWEGGHTDQAVVDRMLSRALRALTGESGDGAAWDKLFRHHNKERGKGEAPYKPGEKIVIKVNFVGLIWREGGVDAETYKLKEWRENYMNTAPQVIIALMRQLTAAGVAEADLTVCDCLAYLAEEYYAIIHGAFPKACCVDHEGRDGRAAAKDSTVPLYWSCRPEGCRQDYVPTCFAEAEYVINLANLKAHTGAGVTLCAKNHCGSFVRWPAQKDYFDMHPSAFAAGEGRYRMLVDLMGHAHLGGKTLLHLIDGLYSGTHPIDRAPSKWRSEPFDGGWTASLFASQDPVAIDSVGLDFLRAEWSGYPHKSGTDDYLHEAALAHDPPSGTFYDPNHAAPTARLGSLGVHEHWNNAREKRYSRNLGAKEGIELVAVGAKH